MYKTQEKMLHGLFFFLYILLISLFTSFVFLFFSLFLSLTHTLPLSLFDPVSGHGKPLCLADPSGSPLSSFLAGDGCAGDPAVPLRRETRPMSLGTLFFLFLSLSAPTTSEFIDHYGENIISYTFHTIARIGKTYSQQSTEKIKMRAPFETARVGKVAGQ